MMDAFCRILILCAVAILPAVLIGQTKTKMGGKVGVNYSKPYFTSTPKMSLSTQKKFGIYIGAPIEIRFPGMLALQLEPSFIQKGYFFYYPRGLLTEDGRVAINYFEMPLFLKLIFGEEILLNIILGPSAAYANGGSLKSPLGKRMPLDFENDDFSKYDFGINFGAGIDIPIKKRHFIFDMRYSYGLKDITNEGRNNTQIKNGGIITTIDFLLPGRKKGKT